MENIDWSPLVEAAVTAFIGVLTVLLPLLFNLIKSYLQRLELEAIDRLGESAWYEVKDWATILINAAQQKLDLDTPEKKKEFVLSHLMDIVEMYAIPATEDQIDALIEGILANMKASEQLAPDNSPG